MLRRTTELDKDRKSKAKGIQVEVFFFLPQTYVAELWVVNTKNIEEFASR